MAHIPSPIQNKSNAKQPDPRERSIRYLKIGLSWLLALAVALTLQRFAFQSYQVFGQSMHPTLEEGDYLIISKLPVTWSELRSKDYVPQRGDIVVVKSPLDETRLIKRVIGLPTERVTVSNGQVKVFNEGAQQGFDPYQALNLPSQYVAGQLTMVVPTDHVFLVGDNRESGGSLDSRNELGPVPAENIVGKLVLRLWPLSKIDTY